MRAQLAQAAGQIALDRFRLHAASAGKGAGANGQDLGADLERVGPGEAYERWKNTAEYQQWLKETGQAKTNTALP
jgi:hypothetical protein